MKAILGIFFAAFALGGCSAAQSDVESRRRASMEILEKHYAANSNPVMARFGQDVAASLRSANAKTLKQPAVGFAIIARGDDGTGRLHLAWIETSPSIDAVEVDLGDAQSQVFTFTDEEKATYREEAKNLVHYSAGHQWANNTPVMKAISRMKNSRQLRVRLLRASAPASEWFPVGIYTSSGWLPTE